MYLPINAAAIVAWLILAGSAQAQTPQIQAQQDQMQLAQVQQVQFRSLQKLPDPRGEFVRLCAPHMVGRWAHPESVCGCLHDHAAAAVEDRDLREALLRGISETGVPNICLLYTSPSPRDRQKSRMPSSA